MGVEEEGKGLEIDDANDWSDEAIAEFLGLYQEPSIVDRIIIFGSRVISYFRPTDSTDHQLESPEQPKETNEELPSL